jgi:hypothetical protein
VAPSKRKRESPQPEQPGSGLSRWEFFLIAAVAIVALLVLSLRLHWVDALQWVGFPLTLLSFWLAARGASREQWSRRKGWTAVAVVAAVLVMSVVRVAYQGPAAAPSPPSTTRVAGTPTLPHPCPRSLIVGTRAPTEQLAKAFRDAYNSHGGEQRLGHACNPVTRLENGYHQNLSGGSAPPGVIMIADGSTRAYVLLGDFDQGFLSIGNGDGVQSVVLAGYPANEGVELRHGRQLEFVTGDGRRSAVVKRHGGDWYWVQSDFWVRYNNAKLRGPEGPLGYPTSVEKSSQDGDCQEFEHGSLLHRAGAGVQVFMNQRACQP